MRDPDLIEGRIVSIIVSIEKLGDMGSVPRKGAE